MWSPTVRITCSRCNNIEPSLTDFLLRNSLGALAPARHQWRADEAISNPNGGHPRRRRQSGPAGGFSGSLRASRFQRKLSENCSGALPLPRTLSTFKSATLLGRAQLVEHFQKGRVVAGDPRTGYRERSRISNALAVTSALLREGLSDLAQDRQVARTNHRTRAETRRICFCRPSSFNLFRPHRGPFANSDRKLPLLDREGPCNQKCQRTGGRTRSD